MQVLINKQYKAYDRVSRYSVFPTYLNRLDEKYIYGITAHIRNDIKHIAHKVVRGDTLDSLALYYYNNPTYYWVIADFNRISDPYADLVIGSTIKIPTFSSIEYDI